MSKLAKEYTKGRIKHFQVLGMACAVNNEPIYFFMLPTKNSNDAPIVKLSYRDAVSFFGNDGEEGLKAIGTDALTHGVSQIKTFTAASFETDVTYFDASNIESRARWAQSNGIGTVYVTSERKGMLVTCGNASKLKYLFSNIIDSQLNHIFIDGTTKAPVSSREQIAAADFITFSYAMFSMMFSCDVDAIIATSFTADLTDMKYATNLKRAVKPFYDAWVQNKMAVDNQKNIRRGQAAHMEIDVVGSKLIIKSDVLGLYITQHNFKQIAQKCNKDLGLVCLAHDANLIVTVPELGLKVTNHSVFDKLKAENLEMSGDTVLNIYDLWHALTGKYHQTDTEAK